MRYFKSLGLTFAERYGQAASIERYREITGQAVKVSQAEGIVSMAQIKADWPKVTRTFTRKRDGVPMGEPRTVTMYVWKFADGTKRETIEWSNEYYLHVTNGTSPARRLYIPNLSKVTLGSREYFRFLCRAQGDGATDPTIQGIRVAFDKRGWTWQATTDLRMRHLSPPYERRPHPSIPHDQIDVCSSFVNRPKTNNKMTWAARAYNYSIDRVTRFEEARIDVTTREHRPSECKNRVPPNQVAACEVYVTSTRPDGSGGTIEDFIDRIQSRDMSQEEFDALTQAGGGETEGLLGGIPKMYLVAGAVGVVVLGAVLLKGRK